DLARDGVAQLEDGLDHLPLVVLDDPALLGDVDEFAQFDLGGERALTQPAARRDRVAEQREQSGQRVEHPADEADGPGTRERYTVEVLAAERARADADDGVADDDHDE